MIRRKFDIIVTIVCVALLGYFAWHAFHGPRGFGYEKTISAQAKDLGAKLDQLRSERKQVRTRIEKLLGQMDLLSENP